MKPFNLTELAKDEFFDYVKNIRNYRILKKLDGELAYAKVGDSFPSDILYERGYNINNLVNEGNLELIPRIFPFEEEIIGLNISSVYTLCSECHSWGINIPLDKTCGNCSYIKGRTYYSDGTIDTYLRSMNTDENIEKLIQDERCDHDDESGEYFRKDTVIRLLKNKKLIK